MKNLIPTFKYCWLTIKHKWFVFRAGLWTKAPVWNLIIHDWSKFTLKEAPYYGNRFFGSSDDPYGFTCAWLHHQNVNPHHWEYWIPRTAHDRGGYPGNEPMPMPEKYVREMVADWFGACRAYEGAYPSSKKNWTWLQNNLYSSKMNLHSETREKVEKVLNEVFDY